MRIYLDISPHPFYESLVLYPPEDIDYVNISRDRFSKEYDKLSIYSKTRWFARKLASKYHYFTSLPRLRFVRQGNYDLYHSGRGVFIIGNVPYVMDFEHIASTYGMNGRIAMRPSSKFILRKLLSSTNLKFILPHSHAARKSTIALLGKDFYERIKDKVKVLYPAQVPWRENPRNLAKDKVTLLFIAASKWKFFAKGGLEVLQAFAMLKDRYDIELIVKSPVSYYIKRKFSDVTFIDQKLSRKEIISLYEKADLFVFPSYIDTWGYVLLEAMATALPIVTSNTFAIPEIVKEYENGLIINVDKYRWDKNYLHDLSKPFHRFYMLKPEIVNQLVEKISELVEDPKLYYKLSKNNLREVQSGRFSIENRNRILELLYGEAVRS